jgi:hypothetical protein
MDNTLLHILNNTSHGSSLIPFSLGWLRFRSNAVYLKLLFGITGVSFICDTASLILYWLKINPNYIGNTYTLVEFIVLSIIYFIVFNDRKLSRIFIAVGTFYSVVFILNLFFLQQEKISSYTETFSSFVFIALSIAFFYRLMKDLPALQIQQLPMFWINTAVLIYFAGNLFLFILTNYLVNILKDDLIAYWTFHNLLNITKNLLFAIGLWQNLRTPKLL